MTTTFWMFAAFAFIFGAIVGSFLNVVIYRVPAGESVVTPPSHCPSCGSDIAWYDNIPIVSWLVLGGSCRQCDEPISMRYALVEALTGLFALGTWVKVAYRPFQLAAQPSQLDLLAILLPFFLYFAFVALLIAIAFVDLDHYIIPHVFTLPGIALGVATPLLIDWLLPDGALYGFWPPVTPTESALGALFGALTVMAIYFTYLAVRGVEGLGGGDVTLMALVGAWLGWPALVFVFFGASAQGTLAAAVAFLIGSDWMKTTEEIYGPEGDEDGGDSPAGEEDPSDEESSQDEATAAGPDDAHQPDDDGEEAGNDGLAVPFGPFITLAAVEHFFLGPYLPDVLSMSYLYSGWYW